MIIIDPTFSILVDDLLGPIAVVIVLNEILIARCLIFQEGMKKDFRVVKLVGKGGDSLLESGENAAGERVTQMVNIWMRTMWSGAQNLVLFTGIFVQDFLNMQTRPFRVQSFFSTLF